MDALHRQAVDAILNRLWMHTVGIVNSERITGIEPSTGRRADGEQVGTGCAARWGEHRFIVTAGHVLENVRPSALRIFCYPGGQIEPKSPSQLRPEDILDALPVADCHAAIHRCSWADVAILAALPDSFGSYVEFADVDHEWHEPTEGERVHVFGFPADRSILCDTKLIGNKEEKTHAIYPNSFDGVLLPLPTPEQLKYTFTGFDLTNHYLIPFEDAAEGRYPGGFSGSAAWWESDEKQIIWRPNFKFAGVVMSCYRKGSVVQVIRPSAVRRFVAEVFGAA